MEGVAKFQKMKILANPGPNPCPIAQGPRKCFAVCVANDVRCDDLTVGVLYWVLPDEAASAESLLRVVDDSGEDYLYPASRFVAIEAAEAEIPRLLAASSANVA